MVAVLQGGKSNWLENLSLMDAGTQVENFPGMSAMASVLGHGDMPSEFTKLAKADYECAMTAIRAHSVAEITTDANARGVLASVRAGTYYLYGRFYRITKPVRGGGMVWDLKLELKPGPNALTLSVANAAYKGN